MVQELPGQLASSSNDKYSLIGSLSNFQTFPLQKYKAYSCELTKLDSLLFPGSQD